MPSFSWETLPPALVKHLHKGLPTLGSLISSFFKGILIGVQLLQCRVGFLLYGQVPQRCTHMHLPLLRIPFPLRSSGSAE